MGTRSTVKFYEENATNPLLSIYNQYDGYIKGVGHDLANFLMGMRIVNGYQTDDKIFHVANGMGCLAAQYIAKFKDDIGKVYITTPQDTEEYNYEVRIRKDRLFITETTTGFKGYPEELLDFEEDKDNEDNF